MRWMRGVSIVIAFGVALAIPGAALANVILAPPGHPGVNEYVEVIPTSAGNAAPPGSVRGSGSASAGPHALAPFGRGQGTDAKLAKLGTTGAAAAALAAATAPLRAQSGTAPNSAARAGSASQSNTSGGGGSIGSALSHALGSSDTGGLGLLLPLLLASALVIAVGVGAARLSRRTPAP